MRQTHITTIAIVYGENIKAIKNKIINRTKYQCTLLFNIHTEIEQWTIFSASQHNKQATNHTDANHFN